MNFYARWNRGCILMGIVFWLFAAIFVPDSYTVGLFEKLFFFAPLVILPLVLLLIRIPDRNGKDPFLYRIIVILQPFSAVAVLSTIKIIHLMLRH